MLGLTVSVSAAKSATLVSRFANSLSRRRDDPPAREEGVAPMLPCCLITNAYLLGSRCLRNSLEEPMCKRQTTDRREYMEGSYRTVRAMVGARRKRRRRRYAVPPPFFEGPGPACEQASGGNAVAGRFARRAVAGLTRARSVWVSSSDTSRPGSINPHILRAAHPAAAYEFRSWRVVACWTVVMDGSSPPGC